MKYLFAVSDSSDSVADSDTMSDSDSGGSDSGASGVRTSNNSGANRVTNNSVLLARGNNLGVMSDNSGVSGLVGGAAGAVLGHGLNAVLNGGHVNDGVANNPGDLPGPGDGGLVAVLDGGGGAHGGIHTPLGAGVSHGNRSHNTGDGSVAVAGVSLSVGLGLGLSLTLVVAVSSHNSPGGGDNSGGSNSHSVSVADSA